MTVSRCRACGWRGLPARLRCPACGGEDMRAAVARRGRLLDATTLVRAPGGLSASVRIGSVRLERGGVIVVRVDGGAEPGRSVRLVDDGGAPVATSL